MWLQDNCATSTEPVVLIVDSCVECSLTVPSAEFADIEDVSVGTADVIVTQVCPYCIVCHVLTTDSDCWRRSRYKLRDPCFPCHVQVDCQPPDNIVIRILEFRPSAGGYLKLVLLNVAGSGAISSLGIRRYQTEVSKIPHLTMRVSVHLQLDREIASCEQFQPLCSIQVARLFS